MIVTGNISQNDRPRSDEFYLNKPDKKEYTGSLSESMFHQQSSFASLFQSAIGNGMSSYPIHALNRESESFRQSLSAGINSTESTGAIAYEQNARKPEEKFQSYEDAQTLQNARKTDQNENKTEIDEHSQKPGENKKDKSPVTDSENAKDARQNKSALLSFHRNAKENIKRADSDSENQKQKSAADRLNGAAIDKTAEGKLSKMANSESSEVNEHAKVNLNKERSNDNTQLLSKLKEKNSDQKDQLTINDLKQNHKARHSAGQQKSVENSAFHHEKEQVEKKQPDNKELVKQAHKHDTGIKTSSKTEINSDIASNVSRETIAASLKPETFTQNNNNQKLQNDTFQLNAKSQPIAQMKSAMDSGFSNDTGDTQTQSGNQNSGSSFQFDRMMNVQKNQDNPVLRGQLQQQIESLLSKAKIQFRANGNANMTANLYPKELGKISIKLSLTDGKLHGKLTVDNELVQKELSDKLEKLTSELISDGFEVSGFDVGVKSDGTENESENHEKFSEKIAKNSYSNLFTNNRQNSNVEANNVTGDEIYA